MFLQRFLHAPGVADVAFDEGQRRSLGVADGARTDRQPFDRLAMPLREVVIDDDVVPRAEERPDGETANVAGAAGDEDGTQRVLPMEKYVKPCAFIADGL
jgi:hypothetical protein